MSNTIPNRLRQAAQYVWQGELYDLLIEAAGALDGAEPFAWLESEPSTRSWPARDLFFGLRSCAYSSRMHFGEKPNVMPNGNRLTPLYTTPQPQERKPLTTQQIADANGLEIIDPYVLVAIAITRNAEKAHGIKD